MKFSRAIDLYVADMAREGRLRSSKSEVSYRHVLECHAEDVQNRDPSKVGRGDIKRTLARWPNTNTQSGSHSILVSFFDWVVEEGYRETNPARQVRRARRQPTNVYRLTVAEAASILAAASTTREQRISHLGLLAGLRNSEMRGLQGKHFRRPGYIWISKDIVKGDHERWLPILPELGRVVADIRRSVPNDHYILPSASAGGYAANLFRREDPTKPLSSQTLQRTVHILAKRAGIAAHIHPHLLRHAFADHVARHAGLKRAQAMLGHVDVATTQIYVGQPTLEELAESVQGIRFGAFSYTPTQPLAIVVAEREGFEPSVPSASDADGDGLHRPLPWDLLEKFSPEGEREFRRKVALYAGALGGARA